MRRPAQNAKRAERTDLQMLAAWRRLPPHRQASYSRQIMEEAAQFETVVKLDSILQHSDVREEARALARGAAMRLTELVEIVNPFSYSSYVARSAACTMNKLSRIEDDRADVLVEVKVIETVRFHHRLIGEDFALHVIFGPVSVRCGSETRLYSTRRIVSVPVEAGDLVIHAEPGAWFKYVAHPLSTWITRHGGAA